MASKFWVQSNEDSKSAFFRSMWEKNNSGKWSMNTRHQWIWSDQVEIKKPVKPKKLKKILIDDCPKCDLSDNKN